MKLPVGWLRDYIEELPELEELERRLTMAGLEVEEMRVPDARLIEHLRVARILEKEQHPNADRLSLCRVDDGDGERQIVCGATNMNAGDAVVLAVPGAVLPGGLKIKKSKIRGQESHGMLCSASELELSDDHSGIMILGADAETGAGAAALLGLDDAVMEIGITPNRGDCLSIRGLAREISAVCAVPLLARFDRRLDAPDSRSRFQVEIEAADACPRYTGIEIRGVHIGPSPMQVVARLAAAGVRALNNVVDVTNLVLLEYGQPLHAFDADLLDGETIFVRAVADGAEIKTLDDEDRVLVAGDLTICDGLGPVALAGVMGGARTAVHEGTTNIFLESALFQPTCVRMTSRRLGLISESSYRFERGVDPAMVEQALLAAAERITELAGGEVSGGVASAGHAPRANAPIELRSSRVDAVLGVAVDPGESRVLLERLGASIDAETGGTVTVQPPTHRSDLVREIDLIEEVARLRGYDLIPDQVPQRAMHSTSTPTVWKLRERLRMELAASGLSEAVGLAFCSTKTNSTFPGLHDGDAPVVTVRNPLNVDASEMRKSILPCLLESHATNARGGVDATDLFSLGRTFARSTNGASTPSIELEVLGGLLWGPRRGRAAGAGGDATVWDAKAYVERAAASVSGLGALTFEPASGRDEYHPRACAAVRMSGEAIGYLGMIHPDVADMLEISREISIFEVDTRKLLEYAPAQSALRPVPRFPASSRDISLMVADEILAGQVIAEVSSLGERLIESVHVFDEYAGEGIAPGHRALAFSIVYRSADGTLTDEEVTALHDRVVSHVVETLGVTVRA